jgi:GntR family transcriptional regulator
MSTPTPSLFKRIESDLRQRILSNELAPGEKLPSESEMINIFGVSRITVRQALSDLQAAGLIEKINGKGSFVSRPLDRPDLGLLTGFYEHMRARGHASRGKIISVRKITAPIAAALALGQPHDSPMTRVTILKTVDGQEVAYGHVIGSNKLIQRLLEYDVEYNDALQLLEARLGYRLDYHDIETQAVKSTKEQSTRLNVPVSSPLLRVKFVTHDVDKRPLLYSDYVFRGDKFSYKVRVRRMG